MILNVKLTIISSPLGKDDWNGAVVNKLRSNRSWEIGSPPAGSARKMKLSSVVVHQSYTSDPFINLKERSST